MLWKSGKLKRVNWNSYGVARQMHMQFEISKWQISYVRIIRLVNHRSPAKLSGKCKAWKHQIYFIGFVLIDSVGTAKYEFND